MSKDSTAVFFKSLAVGVLATAAAFGVLAASSVVRPGVVQAEIEGCEQMTGTTAIDTDDIDKIDACLLIVKDADGAKNIQFEFTFETSGSDEVFQLKHGESQEIYGAYVDLNDGGVIVTEKKKAGWVLVDIECEADAGEDVEFDIDIKNRRVEVTSAYQDQKGQEAISAVCIFYNEPERQPDFVDQGGRFIGGGIFGNLGAAADNRARAGVVVATPQPAPASAPIRAPSTGDGGLLP